MVGDLHGIDAFAHVGVGEEAGYLVLVPEAEPQALGVGGLAGSVSHCLAGLTENTRVDMASGVLVAFGWFIVFIVFVCLEVDDVAYVAFCLSRCKITAGQKPSVRIFSTLLFFCRG